MGAANRFRAALGPVPFVPPRGPRLGLSASLEPAGALAGSVFAPSNDVDVDHYIDWAKQGHPRELTVDHHTHKSGLLSPERLVAATSNTGDLMRDTLQAYRFVNQRFAADSASFVKDYILGLAEAAPEEQADGLLWALQPRRAEWQRPAISMSEAYFTRRMLTYGDIQRQPEYQYHRLNKIVADCADEAIVKTCAAYTAAAYTDCSLLLTQAHTQVRRDAAPAIRRQFLQLYHALASVQDNRQIVAPDQPEGKLTLFVCMDREAGPTDLPRGVPLVDIIASTCRTLEHRPNLSILFDVQCRDYCLWKEILCQHDTQQVGRIDVQGDLLMPPHLFTYLQASWSVQVNLLDLVNTNNFRGPSNNSLAIAAPGVLHMPLNQRLAKATPPFAGFSVCGLERPFSRPGISQMPLVYEALLQAPRLAPDIDGEHRPPILSFHVGEGGDGPDSQSLTTEQAQQNIDLLTEQVFRLQDAGLYHPYEVSLRLGHVASISVTQACKLLPLGLVFEVMTSSNRVNGILAANNSPLPNLLTANFLLDRTLAQPVRWRLALPTDGIIYGTTLAQELALAAATVLRWLLPPESQTVAPRPSLRVYSLEELQRLAPYLHPMAPVDDYVRQLQTHPGSVIRLFGEQLGEDLMEYLRTPEVLAAGMWNAAQA